MKYGIVFNVKLTGWHSCTRNLNLKQKVLEGCWINTHLGHHILNKWSWKRCQRLFVTNQLFDFQMCVHITMMTIALPGITVPSTLFLCLSQTLLGRTNNITELYFTSLGSGWYKVIERRPCSLAVRALGMTFLRLVQPLLIGKTFELYFLKSPWFQSW